MSEFVLRVQEEEILSILGFDKEPEYWNELLDYIKNKFNWTYVWEQIEDLGEGFFEQHPEYKR